PGDRDRLQRDPQGHLAPGGVSPSLSLRGGHQRRRPLAQVLRARRGQRAGAECVPWFLDGGRRYLLHQLSLHRVHETADQRRHSRHLLRPWLPGRERSARPLLESGGDPEPPYRVVADPAPPIGASEGLAAASTGTGSTKKETLNAGWGRDGSAAADGSSAAHAMTKTSQRRQDAPTEEQRPR